jgi:DnaJ-class molecular chaperone
MNLLDACKLLNIRIFELNEENLKKQYRKACLKHHPDKRGDPKLFIKISEA